MSTIEPRVFDIGVSPQERQQADNTPAPFTLRYQDGDGSAQTVDFVAYPKRMPPATLMKIPNMTVDKNSVAMFSAFRAALCGPLEPKEEGGPLEATHKDYARFEELVQRDDVLVQAEQLGSILGWFFEIATGRPTTRS